MKRGRGGEGGMRVGGWGGWWGGGGGGEVHSEFWWENLDIDWSKMLKCLLKKWDERGWTGFILLRIGTVWWVGEGVRFL